MLIERDGAANAMCIASAHNETVVNGDLAHTADAGLVDGHIGQRQIDTTGTQQIDGLAAHAVVNTQNHLGIEAVELLQRRQQQMTRNGITDADAQLAALQCAGLGQLALPLLEQA